jgi:hypothetical protein
MNCKPPSHLPCYLPAAQAQPMSIGITNFLVGLVFLPLRNFLAGGDPLKEGKVFYVFAAILFVVTFALSRVFSGLEMKAVT